MSIDRIENLNVWQESRNLCKNIYDTIKSFPLEEKYNLIKHMKENGRGIPANIAEGFYRFHYQESIRFYLIARGCLGELKSDLYISLDQNYISNTKFDELNNKVEKILIMLNALIKSTRIQKNTTN